MCFVNSQLLIHCKILCIVVVVVNIICMPIVWANFALGSNSVKGKARPNVLCEWIRTSEDDQPRNG